MGGVNSRAATAALLAASAGAFGSLDTALNVAFPDLVDDFDLAVGDLQWIVVFYVLVYGGLLLAAGQLGDAWGYNRVLRIGALVSTVGLIACALAPTFALLLAGRVVQGMGVALVMASAPALLTAGTADSAGGHTRAVGLFQTAAAAGLALGPVVGGPLVEWLGWRGVFWFRVPLGLLLLLLALSAAREPTTNLAKVDRLGAFLVALTLGAAVLALNLGGNRGWSNPVVIAGIAVTVVSASTFITTSLRSAHPVIDPRLFSSLNFSIANVLAVVANGAMFATWLLVPSLLVDELGVSLFASGLILAASPASTAMMSSVVGWSKGHVSGWSLAALGLGLEGLGMIGLSFVNDSWSPIHVALAMAVVGAGLGIFSVPNMALVMRSVDENKQGVAGGLSLMTRTIGVVAGVTAASALTDRFEPTRGFLGSFEIVFVVSGAVLCSAATLALLANRLGERDPDIAR